MDGEQFVQDCCRLSVAVGASPFGRLIAQFVTAAREPALERRHGTTTGSVASAGKQAWTRQQDAAEEGVNPTQDPVLDAKPAPASGTGACQFDDLRRLGFDKLGARVGELDCHKHAHGAPPV